jgi:hypothetical protein
LSDDIELNISVDGSEIDPLIAKTDKLISNMERLNQINLNQAANVDSINSIIDRQQSALNRINAARAGTPIGSAPSRPYVPHPSQAVEDMRQAYRRSYGSFVEAANEVRSRYGMPPIGPDMESEREIQREARRQLEEYRERRREGLERRPLFGGWGARPLSGTWGARPLSGGWAARPLSGAWGAGPLSGGGDGGAAKPLALPPPERIASYSDSLYRQMNKDGMASFNVGEYARLGMWDMITKPIYADPNPFNWDTQEGGGPEGPPPPPPPRTGGLLFEAEKRRRKWIEDSGEGIVPYSHVRGNYYGGIPLDDGKSYSTGGAWGGGAYYEGKEGGKTSAGSEESGTFFSARVEGNGMGGIGWVPGRDEGGADWTWGRDGPPDPNPKANARWIPRTKWGGGRWDGKDDAEDVEFKREPLLIEGKRGWEPEDKWDDPRKNWAPNPEPKEGGVGIRAGQAAVALSALTDAAAIAADAMKSFLGIRLNAGMKAFNTLESVNPLDPFSILKAKERLGGIGGDVRVGFGGMVKKAGQGVGDLTAAFGPVPAIFGQFIKAGTGIGGTMMEMSGMKMQATASIRESAVGIISNLASAITTVLGGAVGLAERGIRLFANTVRGAVGSVTQLLGVSAALGAAGGYAAIRTVNNEYKAPVNDPLRPFTGVSLKQQNIWKQMEQTYGLGENAIYASQLESQRRASSFRTQGQFNNQLPSALAGMIGYMTLDSSFDERVRYLQTAVSKLQTFPSMRNNLENWVNKMGLNTEMQVASMRYEYGLDNSYYAHPRIEEIQKGRIVNGGIYRQLQGVSDAVNGEMANTIYGRGIAGGPTGEQWHKQWIEFKNSISGALKTGDIMGPLLAGANLFHMAGKQVQTTWDAATKRFPAINRVGRDLAGGAVGALKWGGGLVDIIASIGKLKDEDDPSKGRYSIGDAYDYVAGGVGGIAGKMKPVVSEVAEAFKELGPKLAASISGGINFLFKEGGMMEGLVNFFADFGTNVKGILSKVFDGVDMGRVEAVGKALMYNVLAVFAKGFDEFAKIVDKGMSGLIDVTLSRLEWKYLPQGTKGEQNDPRTGKKFEGLTKEQGEAWKDLNYSYKVLLNGGENDITTGWILKGGRDVFDDKALNGYSLKDVESRDEEIIKEYTAHVQKIKGLLEKNGYLGTEIDDAVGAALYASYANNNRPGDTYFNTRKERMDNIYKFLESPQLLDAWGFLEGLRGKGKFFDEDKMSAFNAIYDESSEMFRILNDMEPKVTEGARSESASFFERLRGALDELTGVLGRLADEGIKSESEVTVKTDEGRQIAIDNQFITNILGARGRRVLQ